MIRITVFAMKNYSLSNFVEITSDRWHFENVAVNFDRCTTYCRCLMMVLITNVKMSFIGWINSNENNNCRNRLAEVPDTNWQRSSDGVDCWYSALPLISGVKQWMPCVMWQLCPTLWADTAIQCCAILISKLFTHLLHFFVRPSVRSYCSIPFFVPFLCLRRNFNWRLQSLRSFVGATMVVAFCPSQHKNSAQRNEKHCSRDSRAKYAMPWPISVTTIRSLAQGENPKKRKTKNLIKTFWRQQRTNRWQSRG